MIYIYNLRIGNTKFKLVRRVNMSRVSKKEEAIKAKYEKLSQEAKPKPKYIKNIIMAFLIGGAICTIGQGIFELLKFFGISEYDAKIWLPIIMVFLGALVYMIKLLILQGQER